MHPRQPKTQKVIILCNSLLQFFAEQEVYFGFSHLMCMESLGLIGGSKVQLLAQPTLGQPQSYTSQVL